MTEDVYCEDCDKLIPPGARGVFCEECAEDSIGYWRDQTGIARKQVKELRAELLERAEAQEEDTRLLERIRGEMADFGRVVVVGSYRFGLIEWNVLSDDRVDGYPDVRSALQAAREMMREMEE